MKDLKIFRSYVKKKNTYKMCSIITVKMDIDLFYPFLFVSCIYKYIAEQKARTTYDNILRLVHDSDVCEPIKFLRAREVVHFQRFGEANRTDLSKKRKPHSLRMSPHYDYSNFTVRNVFQNQHNSEHYYITSGLI